MNTYSIFSIDEMDTVGLEDLTNVDLALENTMSSQTDFFYVLIFWVMMIHMFSILRFALKLDILQMLNRKILICSAFQSVLMKHMVSKRMNRIQVKAQETDNVLELLATTRSILGFNQKIDDMFCMRTANVVEHGLLNFLLSLTAFWSIYGLHKEFYCIENHSPVFALLVQCHIFTELFCLGGKISKISNCVESLSWEINKRMSSKEYSIEHRKKLEVFMLELAHTPTDLTAADLFSVDNSFITSVASFIMTVMMVFIQFMT
ncbi:hypothetical protein J6590_079417 [Homalodisca vitripennis]|nr:hypothetical protein J6590_101716 [Homalodisca vitripennis]KAG8315027.1 hypothetical protein J6590_079417 [Homalodisca vitripennis]